MGPYDLLLVRHREAEHPSSVARVHLVQTQPSWCDGTTHQRLKTSPYALGTPTLRYPATRFVTFEILVPECLLQPCAGFAFPKKKKKNAIKEKEQREFL